MLFSSGQTIATYPGNRDKTLRLCCIIKHSPSCYLRGGQTNATLTLNNVGLCCDRKLRRFDQGLIKVNFLPMKTSSCTRQDGIN